MPESLPFKKLGTALCGYQQTKRLRPKGQGVPPVLSEWSHVCGAGQVPPNLKEHAGLQKDIVLVAALNKIEIWDSNKYKQLFDSFSPEAFSNLAKEVMVGDSNKLKS
jgi:hypothetical protein